MGGKGNRVELRWGRKEKGRKGKGRKRLGIGLVASDVNEGVKNLNGFPR